MQLENQNTLTKDDKDLVVLDLDDIEEMDLSGDSTPEDVELKPSSNPSKEQRHIIRKNIEDILEERALRRQLSDVFDEDILLD